MIDLTRTRACKKYNSNLPNMSSPCRRVIPTNHVYNLCCLDHWGAVSQDIRTWQSTRSVRIYRPVWPVVEHSLLYISYIAHVTSGWLIAVNQHSVCTSVTDNCHTNSFLVCYVKRDKKGGQTFTTIRIDDVRNTWSRITVIDCSASFGYKNVYTIILYVLIELYKPNLRSKHLREWSSRSIRSRINMSKIHDC